MARSGAVPKLTIPGIAAPRLPLSKPRLPKNLLPRLLGIWLVAALPLGLRAAEAQDLHSTGAPETPSEQEAEPRETTVVEEITVTAQRREDRLQDVPAAVTVLTAEEIEKLALRTSSQVAGQTPNLEIKSALGNSSPTLFLRGVGVNDFNPNVSGAVGVYSDEVYMGSSSGQVFQLFDLERVEVLRGPQGTLYGRNTTGGTLNFITRKPGGQLGGYGRATFGRYDQIDFEGAFDTPLGESLHALRLSVVSRRRDGTTLNLLDGGTENDIDARAARVQLRLVPDNRTFLLLNVHGGVNRSGARQFQSRGLLDGADALGYVDSPDPFTGSYNRDDKEDLDAFGASVDLQWTGPRFELTSISAWETVERLVLEDTDASPNQLLESDFGDDSWQVSQEVRLASVAGDSFSWIAGVYYLHENLEVDNRFDILRELRQFGIGFNPDGGPFLVRQQYEQTTDSLAPFGQVSWALAENLTLTTGLRFTQETRELAIDTAFVEPELTVPLIDGLQDEIQADEFSGDLRLAWRASEEVLVYASLGRGFKSGGFNGGALFFPEEAAPVEPEFLTSLELGLKSTWLRRRLLLNASAFLYDYQNLQVFTLVNVGGVPVQALDNASDAGISGLELELEARPTSRFWLSLGVGLLDAEYENFVLGDGRDLSGNQLVAAPDWNLNGALRYAVPVAGKGDVSAYLDFRLKDRQFFDATNTPRIGTGGYGLVNGRLGFETDSGRWAVALWGKNLGDKVYPIDILDLSDFGFDEINIGEPRTWGVELTVRFQ